VLVFARGLRIGRGFVPARFERRELLVDLLVVRRRERLLRVRGRAEEELAQRRAADRLRGEFHPARHR
jgi:hypothetical protein